MPAPVFPSAYALANWLRVSREEWAAQMTSGLAPPVVMTSGGFDVPHLGHALLLEHSARYGFLVAVVNGDGFLLRKKGYVAMPLAERMGLVARLEGVGAVCPWDDGTQNVADALRAISPHFFTKGGDRSSPEMMAPEELRACEEVGCEVLYGIGGSEKVNSSSWLAKRMREGAVSAPP